MLLEGVAGLARLCSVQQLQPALVVQPVQVQHKSSVTETLDETVHK